MKKLFAGVLILTLIDAMATAVGVKYKYLEEANPFIRELVDYRPAASCIAACVLAGLLLFFIYVLRHRIFWIRYALSGLFIIKIGLAALHFILILTAIREGYITPPGLFTHGLFSAGLLFLFKIG